MSNTLWCVEQVERMTKELVQEKQKNKELVATLKTLLALHDNDVFVTDPWNTAMEKARVVITKAEGGL